MKRILFLCLLLAYCGILSANLPWLKQKQEEAQGSSVLPQVAEAYADPATKPVPNLRILRNYLLDSNQFTERDYQVMEREIPIELAKFQWGYDYDIAVVDPDYYWGAWEYGTSTFEIAVLPKPATIARITYLSVHYHPMEGKVVFKGKLPPPIRPLPLSMEYFIEKLDLGYETNTSYGRTIRNIVLDSYEYNTADDMLRPLLEKQNRTGREELFRSVMLAYDLQKEYVYYFGDAGMDSYDIERARRMAKKICHIEQLRYSDWNPDQIRRIEAKILELLKRENPFMFQTNIESYDSYLGTGGLEVSLKIMTIPIDEYGDGEYTDMAGGDVREYIVTLIPRGNDVAVSINRVLKGNSRTSQSSGYNSPFNYFLSIIHSERISAQMLRSNGITKDEADYLRNYIYATHGYIFKTDRWKNVFTREAWYRPNRYFAESDLSAVERHNVNVLKDYR
ncbi:MAG: YARHG domain-containing protein [Fusobacteriaceae bacterium]|nr:YARHG domain-containing protein [Fusobacteriaceae bacterium]